MPRLTLGDLKNLVYSRLEGNNLFYQPSEVTDAINYTYWIANLICGWQQQNYPLRSGTTVANRHIYNIPDQIIFPQKVSFEGQALEKTSLSAMSNAWPTFLQDTTATTGKAVSRWCPIGIKKFVLHPADSVGGGLVEISGIVLPDELSSDSDQIFIPKEGVTAVVDESAHLVQCKLQGLPFMQSLTFHKNFESLLALYKDWQTYQQPTFYYDEQVQQ